MKVSSTQCPEGRITCAFNSAEISFAEISFAEISCAEISFAEISFVEISFADLRRGAYIKNPRAFGASVFASFRFAKQACHAHECENPSAKLRGFFMCGRGDSNSHASYGATTSK